MKKILRAMKYLKYFKYLYLLPLLIEAVTKANEDGVITKHELIMIAMTLLKECGIDRNVDVVN